MLRAVRVEVASSHDRQRSASSITVAAIGATQTKERDEHHGQT
jgi:hypothetical protein